MKIKKLFNLENLAYLIIFMLPLYLVKINFLIFPTNVLEILIGVMFFIWFISRQKKGKAKEYYAKYRKYIFSLGVIFLGLFISTFWNGVQNVSWGIIKSWFFVPILFLFLLFEVIDDEEKIQRVFWIFFCSALSVSVIAMVYLFLDNLTFDFRLQAFFNSPNYLAMYLAPATVIFLEKVHIIKEKKWKSIFFLFSFLLILFVFYKTYSYLAWFSLIVSVSIILVLKNKFYFKQNSFFNRKCLILASIILVFIFSQFRNVKFANLINSNPRSSLASRIMIWKASFRMIENNFFFGIGPGNFQKTYLEYQKFYEPYLEWAVPHPHSIFLTFWLYGGILGLLGFLSLLFFYFKDFLRGIKKENTQVFFISLGIMLVILIHGLFDTTYFKNDLAIIFWLNFLVLKLG